VNKQALAVLVNQLGGYDETEKAIGVDADLIVRAVSGERLSDIENAEVEDGFNKLYLKPNFAKRYDIDIPELKEITETLNLTEGKIKDVELENLFRQIVASGEIDTDDIDSANVLFADRTPSQRDQIFSIFENLETVKGRLTERIPYGEKQELQKELSAIRGAVAGLFEAVADDMEKDVDMHNIVESAFWEWFREIFYPD
jgi:hypothetical protein